MKPHKRAVATEKAAWRVIPIWLRPDENNQFLSGWTEWTEDSAGMLDPWIVYDAWSLELACKLITLGYPVDLEAKAKEAKNWPPDAWGWDMFLAMIQVFERACSIARSSVAAGKIKDPDTPAHWIAWAQRMGYSVAHWGPHITPELNEYIKHKSRSAAQDAAILDEIRRQGHDPLALPKPPAGKRGVKADVRAILLSSRKDLFQSKGVFDDNWQRLRDSEKLGDHTV